jgi:hypothetical protein
MPPEAQIVPVEVVQSTETALTVVDVARSHAIVTLDDYKVGQALMAEIKTRLKMLEDTRMGQTRPLDESKKKIMDFFRAPMQKLEDAKAHLNNIMVRWVQEEERKRKAEEDRLADLPRKRAEEEALAAAIEEEQNGNVTEAEKIISEPVYVPPVKVASSIPTSKESHLRTTYSAEVTDLRALVEAIASGKAPLQSVAPDMTFLNGQARSYKDALKIPGVKAISKTTQV